MAGAAERLLLGERVVNRALTATERKLVAAYAEALEAIQGRLAEAFATYSSDGTALSYADMTRYNRLVNLEADIVAEIKRLGGTARRLTIRLASTAFEESYFTTGWEFYRQTRLDLRWGLLDREAVEAAVELPLSGLKLSDRLGVAAADLAVRAREQLTQGIILGESYPKIARRLRAAIDVGAKRALTIARTEAHRCQSLGNHAGYEQADAEGIDFRLAWSATLDGRTRPDHQAMDGVEIAWGEKFTLPDGSTCTEPGLTGVPKQDINCRCTTRAVVAGFRPRERRVRGEGVVEYRTYEEWRAAREGVTVADPLNAL